ncbi:CDP-glycerol glycerophosphotransferase family protein [Geodermatophilus marinus]|uniref:CDP-glycerol glycerophosphotransferase family protein n=1 Tax=Geodermatophilus sp. LHW52908 TaxID=2303986 RepID=UPI000E3D3B1F|nr:CDP-glycerol glycerophosphotransferase family protein [Geodermatophilus sp. LHW52908]RFU23442.1 glycosyl transferase [Geodermatophilus sp. LHW52908]
MPPVPPVLTSRLRSTGGRLVRRLGLLPGGEPDGIGEDAALGDVALAQRVAVFFPEPPRNAYQVEQWLEPLLDLDRKHGVVLLTQDSRTTARLRTLTRLPVHCVARTATLEGLVERGALGLALYASHHPRNFQFLRFASLAHVYVGHGESDKAVSASNQLKAYDFTFVAGQAGVDRVRDELMWFDPDRLVVVGRPQLPAVAPRRPRAAGEPPTVLYAPTWEGAQPAMAYSSVATHGAALVRSLLAEGFRVVYRPHPRTGANRPDVAVADAALRRAFDEPAARATGSTVDGGAALADAFAGADALVTDISSMATEWLPTGRPLVVTVPREAGALVRPSALLEAVPRVTAGEAGAAGALLRRCLETDEERDVRARLRTHYLGDPADGPAAARFVAACAEVLAARDARRPARTTEGPR